MWLPGASARFSGIFLASKSFFKVADSENHCFSKSQECKRPFQVMFLTLYAPTDIAMHKVTTQNYNPGPMGAQEDNQVWTWWCTGGQC
jgi:hypothetical protein